MKTRTAEYKKRTLTEQNGTGGIKNIIVEMEKSQRVTRQRESRAGKISKVNGKFRMPNMQHFQQEKN